MIRYVVILILFFMSFGASAANNTPEIVGTWATAAQANAACSSHGGAGCSLLSSHNYYWYKINSVTGATGSDCPANDIPNCNFYQFHYVGGTCPPDTFQNSDGECIQECPAGMIPDANGLCQIDTSCENPEFEGSIQGIGGCFCPPGTFHKTVMDGSGGSTKVCAPTETCNINHPGYLGTAGNPPQPICSHDSMCPPGYQGGMVSHSGITQLVCVPDISGGNDNDGPFSDSDDLDGDGVNNGDDPDIDGDGILNDSDPCPYDPDPNCNNFGNQPPSEGEQQTGSGSASNCSRPPTSTGDPQLAAIHQQLWINKCADDYEQPSYTSSGTCGSSPNCEAGSSDWLLCQILIQEHEKTCAGQQSIDNAAGEFAGEAGGWGTGDLEGMQSGDLLSNVPGETLDYQTVVGTPLVSGVTTGTCPADIPVNIGFTTINFSFSFFCDLAGYIRPLVLLLSMMLGGTIMLRAAIGD